jgi:hypothetical protein
VQKIVQKQGKNEDGEAARKRMLDVREQIESLVFVGENLGPLAASRFAHRNAAGESVLRLIDVARDPIMTNEIITLPVSPGRVRCVPLTAFVNVAGGRRREERRMLVVSSLGSV